MERLLVLYGHPNDPQAFDKYYEEIHIPLGKKMKGLKKWTVGKVLNDPSNPSPFYYIADLYAENKEAMDKVLASPEGKETADDVPNFATGGVTFLRTEVKEII